MTIDAYVYLNITKRNYKVGLWISQAFKHALTVMSCMYSFIIFGLVYLQLLIRGFDKKKLHNFPFLGNAKRQFLERTKNNGLCLCIIGCSDKLNDSIA